MSIVRELQLVRVLTAVDVMVFTEIRLHSCSYSSFMKIHIQDDTNQLNDVDDTHIESFSAARHRYHHRYKVL